MDIIIQVEDPILNTIALKHGWTKDLIIDTPSIDGIPPIDPITTPNPITFQKFMEGVIYQFIKDDYVGIKATELGETARVEAIVVANQETQVIQDKIDLTKP